MAPLRRLHCERRKKFRISGQPQKASHIIHSTSSLKQSAEARLKTFVQRSTIPGLARIVSTGPLNFSKLLWISALFGGLFVSVWQSHFLIKDYQSLKTLQITSYDYPSSYEFPSVTVCTNNPIEFRRALLANNSIALEIQNRVESYEDTVPYDDYVEMENEIIEKLIYVPERIRFDWGAKMEDFIMECKYEHRNCTRPFYQFHNPFYGNCFTFNPRFDGHVPVRATKNSELNMIVRLNGKEVFPLLGRDMGPAIIVHPSGSAPVMHYSTVVIIYPGNKAKISLTKNIIKRLPSPYASKCVNHTNWSVQNRSYFYTAESPYFYSSEACIQSCLQQLYIQECQCIYQARFALPPGLISNENGSMRLCDLLNGSEKCELGRSKPVPIEGCQCPSPCREISYDFDLFWDKKWLTQDRFQQSISGYTNTTLGFGEDLVAIDVVFSPVNHMQMSEEEPSVTLAQFYSNIGGNLGLCLGVSLLSFIEILEFFLQLINDMCEFARFKVSRARVPTALPSKH